MKIYISYSGNDGPDVDQVVKAIKKSNLGDILLPQKEHVDNIEKDHPFAHKILSYKDKDGLFFSNQEHSRQFRKLEEKIIESDVSVIFYSENYKRGILSEREMNTIVTNYALNSNKRVFVFLLDDSKLLSDLELYPSIKIDGDVNTSIKALLKFLSDVKDDYNSKNRETSFRDSTNADADELHKKNIQNLRSALNDGTLTLVTGAGISRDAHVPDWNELLESLLSEMLVKHLGKAPSRKDADSQGFEELKESSSLIIGQYLKNSLQSDFLNELRAALYKDVKKSSPAIDAICEMAKPRRGGNDLDSIITFNFDDLLERNLEAAGVKYKEIYREGERAASKQIPVYHVHGFLPEKGEIRSDMSVVFSEDAYHDQFIDPFSWSNLIQLSKYGQNTCLFVGLSLSDPNLRRLLDVSNRKEVRRENRHYMIQKRRDSTARGTLIETLKEQDAAGLGLGIIWVNDYKEVPQVLRQISS